jgi:phage terminase small subunit
MAKRGLRPKQQIFVREYLIDLNATAAAIRAGYSPATAQEQGSRLLSNVMVRRAIHEGMKRRIARTEVTADKVVRELAIIAFSDIGHYDVDDKGRLRVRKFADRGARRAVRMYHAHSRRRTRGKGDQQVTETEDVFEVRLWDKVAALGLLCRHLGMLGTERPDPIDDLIAKFPHEVADPLRQMLRDYAAGNPPALPE